LFDLKNPIWVKFFLIGAAIEKSLENAVFVRKTDLKKWAFLVLIID